MNAYSVYEIIVSTHHIDCCYTYNAYVRMRTHMHAHTRPPARISRMLQIDDGNIENATGY